MIPWPAIANAAQTAPAAQPTAFGTKKYSRSRHGSKFPGGGVEFGGALDGDVEGAVDVFVGGDDVADAEADQVGGGDLGFGERDDHLGRRGAVLDLHEQAVLSLPLLRRHEERILAPVNSVCVRNDEALRRLAEYFGEPNHRHSA